MAIAILVFATQENRYGWVSVAMVRRSPLSVIAIIGPLAIWIMIVDAAEINFNYAGLFTPAWIAFGMRILAIYDAKNGFTVERQKLKDEENQQVVQGSLAPSAPREM
ncbi:hypothetical protein CGCTS75_v001501 [Colletotrichum tropicale]|nr:hypothetical protein CGCTS75_v001501 [Colletotrichum tropicale]